MTLNSSLSFEESNTTRYSMFLLTCSVLILPWIFAPFPPITDLAQQLAQVRLLDDALFNPQSLYSIQWDTPNRLIYIPLYLFYKVLPISIVGGSFMFFLTVLWSGSIHFLAYRFNISSTSAILACIFIFNSSLYWGLLNFLGGWPIFVLWVIWTVQMYDREEYTTRHKVYGFILTVLLFLAHALWFAFGLFWMGCVFLFSKRNKLELILRSIIVVPVFLWALHWRINIMGQSNYAQGGARWDMTPIQKLKFTNLYIFSSGHIEKKVPMFIIMVLLIGLLLGVIRLRKAISTHSSFPLFCLGLLFLGMYLCLPRKYNNTIEFDRRWLAPGFILLSLSIPSWSSHFIVHRVLPVILFIVFFVSTTFYWSHFQKEMQGFAPIIYQIPKKSKLMGLDFIRYDSNVSGLPFMHMFAYNQVYNGGQLNFSFASYPTLLVRFKQLRRPPWITGLEWNPRKLFVRRGGRWVMHIQSLLHFDYLLIHGAPKVQRIFGSLPHLNKRIIKQNWGLYQIRSQYKIKKQTRKR